MSTILQALREASTRKPPNLKNPENQSFGSVLMIKQ
jgi:hypothetical protein